MFIRKFIQLVFLCFALFSFSQCKTVDKKTKVDNKAIQQGMKNITSSALSPDKSMELVIKEIMKVGDPATHFEYTVYKKGTKQIVKQGTFRGTAIKWNDNTSLKLFPYVGMEQKPDSDNPEQVRSSNNQPQILIVKLYNL